MRDLNKIFKPDSVAVIGASNTPGKVGYIIVDNMVSGGYQGKIYPVNPNADGEIQGLKAYANIKDIPDKVDLVIMSIPAVFVNDSVRDCGEAGVENMVVISAGFKEIGEEGAKLEEELTALGEEYGINIIGPNSLGTTDSHTPLNSSFSQMMPPAGNIAFISQSGAMMVAILDWSVRSGIGFSKVISLGNKAGVTETELTDNELGNIELYYYLITAVTSDGEGVATTSPQVMAGSSYKTPYSTEFVNKAEADQWTVVDANQDGTKFDYRDYMEPYGLMMYASEFGSNDYVISPAISMKGGTTYKVKFNVYFHYSATDYDPERFQTFSITAGAGTTAEAQNIELKKWDNFQHFNYYETLPFEAFFTPEKDGDYNVAYRFFDSPVYDVIVVTAASVEEVFDNDLAAMSLEGTLNPAKGAASDYTVKVKNEGGKAVNSYKVQVVRLDGAEKVVIGETEVNEALESQKETDVKVSVTPDVEGDVEFAANVVLQGDQNDLNNTTEPMLVSIAAEGTIPINYTVTNGDEGVNTRVPMSFVEYGSYSQCIYHASEMKLAGKPKIQITLMLLSTLQRLQRKALMMKLKTGNGLRLQSRQRFMKASRAYLAVQAT